MPPISLLIKPASGNCNMRCKYCFYVNEMENRQLSSRGIMETQTVKKLVDRALSFADGSCTFAFQGGEPSLAGLDYFRAFSNYVKHHPNPKNLQIQYTFQTNGYDLNEEWMEWFSENHVLVGVSLDGPRELHDRYRMDCNGEGTFSRIMSTIKLLERYHVDFNILSVVTSAVAGCAQDVACFFKKNGFVYQQYIECIDPIGEEPGKRDYSLTPDAYEGFLKQIFDVWYLDIKAGHYTYNRYFENLMLIMIGQNAECCNMRGICGVQWVIEADGSVYPCDFYALDEWYLGNICTNTFEQMEEERQKLGFILWSGQIPEDCRNCRYLALCRNGCRRNREPVTADSTQKNYFCSAYKGFFEYAYPRLTEICGMLIGNGR